MQRTLRNSQKLTSKVSARQRPDWDPNTSLEKNIMAAEPDSIKAGDFYINKMRKRMIMKQVRNIAAKMAP